MKFYVAQTIYVVQNYVCKMKFYVARTLYVVQNYVCRMKFYVARTQSQNCHLMRGINKKR